jgi:hypothetical protein
MEQIRDVWRERERQCWSGRFVWDTHRIIYPGAIDIPGKGALPKESVETRERHTRFSFDGDKFAYYYYLMNFSGAPAKPQLSANAFNGSTATSYWPPKSLQYGEGTIHERAAFREFGNVNIWPFLLTFRPISHEGIGLADSQVIVEDASEPVLNRDCIVLRSGESPFFRRLYVASGEKFHVVRCEQLHDSADGAGNPRLLARLDIAEYRRHDDNLRVPARWQATFYKGDQSVESRTNAHLTDYSLNEEIPEREFSLVPFPDGTLVNDERDNSKWWQRADGAREPISPLAALAPDEAARQNKRLRWLLWLNLTAVVCFVVFVIWKRMRNRARQMS